jgi:hypothetical protein
VKSRDDRAWVANRSTCVMNGRDAGTEGRKGNKEETGMMTKPNTRPQAFRALAEYIHGQIANRGPLTPREISMLCGVNSVRARKTMEGFPELFHHEGGESRFWSALTGRNGQLDGWQMDVQTNEIPDAIADHIVSPCWMRVNLSPRLRKAVKFFGSDLSPATVAQLVGGLSEHDRILALDVCHHLTEAVNSSTYVHVGSLLLAAVEGDWRLTPDACKVEGNDKPVICRLARELDMLTMRSRGATFEEIGREFGLTRERVRQLLDEHELLIEAQRSKMEIKARTSLRIEVASVIAANPGVSKKVLCARVGAPWEEVNAAIPARWVKFLGAGVRQQKLRWSETKILSALQMAAEHETPLSQNTFDRLVGEGVIDCCSTVRIAQVFGKWSRACEMAGVKPVQSWIDVYERKWTEEDCLEWLCEFLLSEQISRSTECFSKWSKLQQGDPPSAGTIRSILGQWSTAINRALVELGSGHYSARHKLGMQLEIPDTSQEARATLLGDTLLRNERPSNETSVRALMVKGDMK